MLEEKSRSLEAIQASHELEIKQFKMELEKERDKLANVQMRLQGAYSIFIHVIPPIVKQRKTHLSFCSFFSFSFFFSPIFSFSEEHKLNESFKQELMLLKSDKDKVSF